MGRASFTSKDDKLKAGQTREGVLSSGKSELIWWPKIGLFIVELSCDWSQDFSIFSNILGACDHDSEITSFHIIPIGQFKQFALFKNGC